jgi:hypothetical protein
MRHVCAIVGVSSLSMGAHDNCRESPGVDAEVMPQLQRHKNRKGSAVGWAAVLGRLLRHAVWNLVDGETHQLPVDNTTTAIGMPAGQGLELGNLEKSIEILVIVGGVPQFGNQRRGARS